MSLEKTILIVNSVRGLLFGRHKEHADYSGIFRSAGHSIRHPDGHHAYEPDKAPEDPGYDIHRVCPGTPLMVQLTFMFYGLPMAGITFPDISFIPNFSRYTAGIVAMSMNSCAYVAEIIRSGIQAVDVGQMEAARSLGFRHSQAMSMVILPPSGAEHPPCSGQ